VGPVTAHALREAGVQRTVLAGDTTGAAVVEVLEETFCGRSEASAGRSKRENEFPHASAATFAAERSDSQLVRETRLAPSGLIYPMFVCPGYKVPPGS